MSDMGQSAARQLRAFIDRIERLEEEKVALAADIREVYSEAKANGFDAKVMRRVVSTSRMDATERQEQEALYDTYMLAIETGG